MLESGSRLRGELNYYDYGVVSIKLERPFQADWPQLIRLPGRLIDFKRAYPHQEVVWMFRAEEDVLSGGPDINEPFVTLEPGADGNYQVTEDP